MRCHVASTDRSAALRRRSLSLAKTSFVPRGAQPRIGVILVLAQVSSMKTRRLGSSRP